MKKTVFVFGVRKNTGGCLEVLTSAIESEGAVDRLDLKQDGNVTEYHVTVAFEKAADAKKLHRKLMNRITKSKEVRLDYVRSTISDLRE